MSTRSPNMAVIERKVDFKKVREAYNGDKSRIMAQLSISAHVYTQLHDKYILKGFIPAPSPNAPLYGGVDLAKVPAPSNGGNGVQGAAQALAAALAEVKGDSMNAEQVKALIHEIMGDRPPHKIVIDNRDKGTEKEIKGTVPAEFERVLALAQARRNILLVGPTGCGKTHLAGMIAEALDLDFSFISVSAGTSESQFAGWLLPIGENGKFEYLAAPFVERYQNGGIFLADEIDNGDANTLNFVNAALSNDHMSIPNRPDMPLIKRHEDFIFIAAANTYGHGANRQYVGRNQLDAATLDRFKIGTVSMDYDPAVEKALIREDVLIWGRAARKKITAKGIRRPLSMRFLKDLSTMAEDAPKFFGSKATWDAALTEGWTADEKAAVC